MPIDALFEKLRKENRKAFMPFIAAGDPDLWAAIFLANRDAVLGAVDQFSERMAQFRQLLDANDRAGLVRWLAEGKRVRDALGS